MNRSQRVWAIGAVALAVAGTAALAVRQPGGANRAATGPTGPRPTKIEWQPSLAAARKQATSSGKPIMVVFHASWCGACKMMEKQVLPHPTVVDAAQKWVTVRVDTDKEQAIAYRYGIRSLPTVGFLKADGQPVTGFEGAPGPDDMARMMDKGFEIWQKEKDKK